MLSKKIIFALLAVFVLGWLSSAAYSTITAERDSVSNGKTSLPESEENKEKQYLDDLKRFEKIEELFSKEEETREKPSPHDWISMDQIYVYDNQVLLKIDNPEWAMYTDTKSMDPVIDSTSNSIEVIPQSEKDIHVGDIVAYESKYKDGTVTHRVVETGHDSKGWYAILKGDNNESPDPGKVRFHQIKRVVVAIIY